MNISWLIHTTRNFNSVISQFFFSQKFIQVRASALWYLWNVDLLIFWSLEDEQGADYEDNDLIDALADIIIDRQEKVLS